MRIRRFLFVVTSVLSAISTAGCWDGQAADFSRWQDSGVVADSGAPDEADASMDSQTGESSRPDENGAEDGGDETDGGTRADGTASGICGNGALESDEQCDDENETSGDGCSEACQIEEAWFPIQNGDDQGERLAGAAIGHGVEADSNGLTHEHSL